VHVVAAAFLQGFVVSSTSHDSYAVLAHYLLFVGSTVYRTHRLQGDCADARRNVLLWHADADGVT
jgi:hypothetical protein